MNLTRTLLYSFSASFKSLSLYDLFPLRLNTSAWKASFTGGDSSSITCSSPLSRMSNSLSFCNAELVYILENRVQTQTNSNDNNIIHWSSCGSVLLFLDLIHLKALTSDMTMGTLSGTNSGTYTPYLQQSKNHRGVFTKTCHIEASNTLLHASVGVQVCVCLLMSASLLVIWEIKQFQNGLVKECSLCESQAETGRTMHSSIAAISHALGLMCKTGMVLLTAAVHSASAPHLHCSSPALTLCRPYGVGHLAAELRTVNEEACRYMCRHHHK